MSRFRKFFAIYLIAGCSQTPMRREPVPAKNPAKEEQLGVQICTPGHSFKLGGPYMVIKLNDFELFFSRIEYQCHPDDGEISLSLNQPKISRSIESCKSYSSSDYPLIPRLLFMQQVGSNDLPLVYSRADMMETIARLFAQNPCLHIKSPVAHL
ncbi:MAG: hypothetical protein NUV81_00300 [bacterium]|nr:hypothetical protein [bacterium]